MNTSKVKPDSLKRNRLALAQDERMFEEHHSPARAPRDDHFRQMMRVPQARIVDAADQERRKADHPTDGSVKRAIVPQQRSSVDAGRDAETHRRFNVRSRPIAQMPLPT
jgi:uncharacterized protein (DUF305 family)